MLFSSRAARCVIRRIFAVGFLCISALVVSLSAAQAASPKAVVFMYHRFGDSRYPSTNIRMEQFADQVSYLSENGFSVLPLETIVKAIQDGTPLPEKSVAITIDDAFASVYENGYPILKEKGWPFTVFVCTDPVDEGRTDYMTWNQMREMKANGASFANHMASHDYLIKRLEGEDEAAWLVRLEAGVIRAGKRLGEELGDSLPFFAYPYGEYNAQVAALLEKLGYVAFGQHSGAFGVHSDLKRVPRFPISEVYGRMSAFKTKAKSLPLPISTITPWDPVTTDRMPVLEVELESSDDIRLDEMACYVAGKGKVEIEWVVPGKRFKVTSGTDLPLGRNKYNITAPSKGGGYYWFSRQWVIQKPL